MCFISVDTHDQTALAEEQESGRHPIGAAAGTGLADVGDLLRLTPPERGLAARDLRFTDGQWIRAEVEGIGTLGNVVCAA